MNNVFNITNEKVIIKGGRDEYILLFSSCLEPIFYYRWGTELDQNCLIYSFIPTVIIGDKKIKLNDGDEIVLRYSCFDIILFCKCEETYPVDIFTVYAKKEG